MFTLLKTVLPIAKAVWEFSKPAVTVAGQVVIAYGAVVAGTTIASTVGKGIGKGLDGARHAVGYTDNLFSASRRMTVKKAKKVAKSSKSTKVAKARKTNVVTSSGNSALAINKPS